MSTLAQFTEHLASRPDASLAAFLCERPDLLAPPATDFSALAARASTRSSLSKALELLNAPELQTLTTLVVLESASVSELSFAVGSAPLAVVAQILDRLEFLGLVLAPSKHPEHFNHDAGTEVFLPLTSLREVLGAHPAGLGRSFTELASVAPGEGIQPLSDASNLGVLLANAPAGASSILDALDGHPLGLVGKAQRGPVDWLLSHGLLVSLDSTHVELPREVALALRGGRVFIDFASQPSSTSTSSLINAAVRENAAHNAMAASLRTMSSLLLSIAGAPLPTLRTGGVGVRAVRSLGKELDLEVDDLSFYLELAAMASLITLDPDTSQWRCSRGTWTELPREQQWLWLVAAWFAADRLPALVGTGSPVVTVLGAGTFRPEASVARATTLALLATIQNSAEAGDSTAEISGASPGDLEAVVAPTPQEILQQCAWYHPRMVRRLPSMLTGFLSEAEQLGLTGAGALTGVGQLVADNQWDKALVSASLAFPAAITELFIQSDLSAIAPGYLDPVLAAELSLTADPEGKGAAAIHRFSEASIARALDSGRTGEQIIQFLDDHSVTPLPQSLVYLIRDTASRHGRLTLGAAGSFIQASTDQLLAEFLVLPVAQALGFVALSDTVAATAISPLVVARTLATAEVRVALAQGDFSLDGPAAVSTTPRDASGRNKASAQRARKYFSPEPEQEVPAVLAQLITAPTGGSEAQEASGVELNDAHLDSAADQEPRVKELALTQVGMLRSRPVHSQGQSESQQGVALEKLRQALRDGREIWLSTAVSDGTQRRERVKPLELTGGRLRLRDPGGSQRTQSIHRIIDVELVEEQSQ